MQGKGAETARGTSPGTWLPTLCEISPRLSMPIIVFWLSATGIRGILLASVALIATVTSSSGEGLYEIKLPA